MADRRAKRSKLTQREREILKRSSSSAIVDHSKWVKRYLKRGCWLAKNNVYRKDPIRRICKYQNPTNSRDIKHLGEYIATSAPIHLFDGWKYLGQALHAHVLGHNGLAIHLAYYAELRATISLLATQGIGIFDNQHYVVEDLKKIHCTSNSNQRGKGTHVATWLYFEWWVNQTTSSRLFSDMIKVRSEPLDSWIGSMPVSKSWNPVARELMLQFGLDLKHMYNDRHDRNAASYRPSFAQINNTTTLAERIQFLLELVRGMERSGEGFVLDDFILRTALKNAYSSVKGRLPIDDPHDYASEISRVVALMSTSDESEAHLYNFLSPAHNEEEDPMFIREASQIGTQNHPRKQFQVLSRAVLLLRVATGSVRHFLYESDITFGDFEFWWKAVGVDIGLWGKAFDVEQVSDSWVDVSEALYDIEKWLLSGGEVARDFYEACSRQIQEATNLGRIAILGLCE